MSVETRLFLDSEEKTILLANIIAQIIRPNSYISLKGDLGAGKSFFARAFIRAHLEEPDMDVPSPSFSLLYEYVSPDKNIIYHCDFYRFNQPQEVLELDLPIIVGYGFSNAAGYIALVEWAEKAQDFLIPADLEINFISDIEKDDINKRKIILKGKTELIEQIEASFKKYR